MKKKKIFVVVGPTASGKSSFALDLAQQNNGTVVNADAMQIYKDLSVLTARPTEKDTEKIPHLLYGYADANYQGTVWQWLDKVVPVLQSTNNPVLVGGTGLYVSALINGVNDIPPVDENIRNWVRSLDIDDVRKRVKDFPFTDPQRQRRALEVLLSTGKPLAYFLEQPKKKLLDADFKIIFINPPRPVLYDRCAKRLNQMFEDGVIDEVKQLMAMKPTGGVSKSIGYNEIVSYLQGDISKKEMESAVLLATRHYAKRQVTWFRHQIQADLIVENPTPKIAQLVSDG